MGIHFRFSEEKALAALSFIASERPGLSPFFLSKVLFYAEKEHINRYGRPILGDNYIRMQDGPVPSRVKDYIDQNWDEVPKPENFDRIVKIRRGLWLRWLYAGAEKGDFSLLSETDMDCIRGAIEFCRGKSKDELSDLTHKEKAWLRATTNRSMDYEDFVDDDNPHKDEVVGMLKENAAYGVL